jgi:PEP-CTERM motif-containing protein
MRLHSSGALLLLSLFLLCAAPCLRADIISVDAVLSQSQLSPTEPITFSVDFGTQFASLSSISWDSFFIGDLFDPGEVIFFSNIGGFKNIGNTSVSSRVLTSTDPFTLNQFLNGQFTGTIFAQTSTTTVTFERITFVADGVPIPEPSTLLLLCTGLLGMAAIRTSKLGR